MTEQTEQTEQTELTEQIEQRRDPMDELNDRVLEAALNTALSEEDFKARTEELLADLRAQSLQILQMNAQQTLHYPAENGTGPAGYIQWQTGPHAEGRNGIEVDELLEAVIDRVRLLQTILPCTENQEILDKLAGAVYWVRERRRRRDRQGVRGTMLFHTARPLWLGLEPEPVSPSALTEPALTGSTSAGPEPASPSTLAGLAELSELASGEPRPLDDEINEAIERSDVG